MSDTERSEPQGPHLLLYRITEYNPPEEWDLTSQQERGRPLRFRTAKGLRLWSGVSVYRSPRDAESLAIDSPHLGRFIAELRVPLDGSIRMELNNGRHGHCTIWGPPALLIKLIIRVWSIEGVH
jgi:hypothetical protein